MSLATSRGRATVRQLCETFGISRQAYYAARKAPQRESRLGVVASRLSGHLKSGH